MPGDWGTWVNFCWVYAAGLSEPLPHYSGARSRARAKRSSGAGWVSKSPHPGAHQMEPPSPLIS